MPTPIPDRDPSVRAMHGGVASLNPGPKLRTKASFAPRVEAVSPLALVMIVVLGALVLPPLFVLIRLSLTVTDASGNAAWSLANYGALFSDKRFFESALNSVTFAALSTALPLIVGGATAWFAARTNAPLRWLAHFTTILSMGTPYILYVMGWTFLFGRIGPVNQIWQALTGSAEPLVNVYSMAGMVFIEGFLWSPLVFLMLFASFKTANVEMEEAARVHGASTVDILRRISLPLVRPAIIAMALFIFIRNIESFDVPVLVGMPGHIPLMTTDIFFSISNVPPDLGHASSFAVVLLFVVIALMVWYGRISRSAEKFASITGKNFKPRPFDLEGKRWIGTAIFLLYCAIVLVLPLAALMWMSLVPFIRPMSFAAMKFFTLSHYTKILGDAGYVELAQNTLMAGAGAATLAMALAAVAGWLAARRRPGGMLVDQLTSVPLVFPGVVLGFALMEVALQLPVPLYGTVALLALALTVRYLPYGMRYAYTGVLQIHRELEEASQVNGASNTQTLRKVVMPLLAPAMASGWLFVFLLATRELALPLILSGPRSQIIPVALYDLSANGQTSELAAFGLVWTLAMMVCACLLFALLNRRSSGVFK
jgi:iron(III) transport system permease protein